MKKSVFDDYTKQYSVSKTLKFELIPQGETLENILKTGVLGEDEHRQESYKKVKKLIDEYHKVFISEALEGLHLDLSRFKILYSIPSRSADEEKEFEECQKKLRKQIVDHIKEDERFENLFNEKFITEEMVHFCVNEDDRKLLDEFSNFTSYFTGFFDNRKNMYSEEENSSAIAFRIINADCKINLDI